MIKKLNLQPEGVILNAPSTIESAFVKLGFSTSLNRKIKSKNTLVFVNNFKEYVRFLKTGLNMVALDSVLWFAYPKCCTPANAGINLDTLERTARLFGIIPVTMIVIDDKWSASRFRPLHELEGE